MFTRSSYDCDGEVVLPTHDVEVGEHHEHEVVVGLDETGPCGDVLDGVGCTRMASMSISMRWVCLESPES